jgi:hypothetical protein
MTLSSFELFAPIEAINFPLFSVVLTDWLSMTAALGFGLRPSSIRKFSRKILFN